MIEAQFGGRELSAAVLAAIAVAGEYVATVQLYRPAREAVVKQQPDDSRDGQIETYATDHVFFTIEAGHLVYLETIGLELAAK